MAGRNWTRKSIEELIDWYLRKKGGQPTPPQPTDPKKASLTIQKSYRDNTVYGNDLSMVYIPSNSSMRLTVRGYEITAASIYYLYVSNLASYTTSNTTMADDVKRDFFTLRDSASNINFSFIFCFDTTSNKIYRLTFPSEKRPVLKVATLNNQTNPINQGKFRLRYGYFQQMADNTFEDAINMACRRLISLGVYGHTGELMLSSYNFTDDELKARYPSLSMTIETIVLEG